MYALWRIAQSLDWHIILPHFLVRTLSVVWSIRIGQMSLPIILFERIAPWTCASVAAGMFPSPARAVARAPLRMRAAHRL